MNEFKTEVNKALASFELEVHKGIEYVSTIKKDIIQAWLFKTKMIIRIIRRGTYKGDSDVVDILILVT